MRRRLLKTATAPVRTRLRETASKPRRLQVSGRRLIPPLYMGWVWNIVLVSCKMSLEERSILTQDEPEGVVIKSRFLRSQPRRIGLGHPLGRDPSRKVKRASQDHSRISDVASSKTASSTWSSLRSAASRKAATAFQHHQPVRELHD